MTAGKAVPPSEISRRTKMSMYASLFSSSESNTMQLSSMKSQTGTAHSGPFKNWVTESNSQTMSSLGSAMSFDRSATPARELGVKLSSFGGDKPLLARLLLLFAAQGYDVAVSFVLSVCLFKR